MAVMEFSADAERTFREAGLTPPYVEALRKQVYNIGIMRSRPIKSAGVKRALNSVHDAARRLKASLTKIKRPPSERSPAAIAGFVLDNSLALVEDPEGDVGVILDGNPIAEELAKLERLCEATSNAIRDLRDFAPPAKKGGQRAWNATPAIYHALERVWTRDVSASQHAAGVTTERPVFMKISHAVDSPFRRIVDACYREAGLVEGVPKKAFEAFVTQRIGQRKELRRAIGEAWDAEQRRIRNE